MSKLISWNHVSFKLPSGWEVTNEGGSRFNGVIVAAPEEGGKLEIYWRRSGGKKIYREHGRYVSRFIKKGFEKRSSLRIRVKGHEAYVDALFSGELKLLIATWFCDETNRLFIAQMDGTRISKPLFLDLLNTINCHPGISGVVDWRLMGIGLRLYSDYFLVDRVFRIGYSMAYFLSRDKKVHVLQYSVPRYVVESISYDQEEVWNRHVKMLIPKFTFLDRVSSNSCYTYVVRHRFVKRLKYGVLLEKRSMCRKPEYMQYTMVKTSEKRLEEAREIINNTLCVEW